MRWWMILLILIGVGVGFYFKVMTLDPLAVILLVLLLWTQKVSMDRQQQLADLIVKAHGVTAANHKEILKRIEELKTSVRGLK